MYSLLEGVSSSLIKQKKTTSISLLPFPKLVSFLLDKVEAELDRGKRTPVMYRFGTVYIALTVQ